ncbi:MAG: AMP-binding protein, partial [Bradyrhizobium sp.]|nr:AMP-binding protein [Bradyrhizobium sp.]
MALKTFNPTTPGQRQLVMVDRSALYKGKPVKALTEGKLSSGGRNNTGRITVRFLGGGHKQSYRMVDFKRDKVDVPATVERLEYDPNRTAFIALVKYQDGELAYILNNSRSRLLITSVAKLDVAREALQEAPGIELCIVVDGHPDEFGTSERIVGLAEATAGLPATPIADESVGTAMLYSSGTTGRPKGILRPLPEQPPLQQLPIFDFLERLWRYREGMIYLSPA